eukprot:GEMP01046795.1.p1 GENE.GEMP01046795.1~~GEMP01046795.1.p1  ORF type:complete len:263 (+),score=68.71 GEMP01046795.1:82-870(+)
MISTMDISGASDAAWATLFAAQDAHLRNLGFYTRPLANQGGLGPLEHANDLGNDPQRDDQDGRTEQLFTATALDLVADGPTHVQHIGLQYLYWDARNRGEKDQVEGKGAVEVEVAVGGGEKGNADGNSDIIDTAISVMRTLSNDFEMMFAACVVVRQLVVQRIHVPQPGHIKVLVRFLSLCKDDKLLEIILDTLEMLFSAEGIRSVRSTQITACKERISVGDALLRLTGKPSPIMTRVHRLGRQFNSMIREPQLDRHHGPNI